MLFLISATNNNKSQETNKCLGFYYSSLEGMKSNDGELGTI